MLSLFKSIKSKEKLVRIRNVIICTLILSFSFNIYGMGYIFSQVDEIKKESSISTITCDANPVFSFESKSQILMEVSTGKIIYANNENERLSPASVTKIMTLLLVMEAIDNGKLNYTDQITCSKKAAGLGGSQIWFEEGEKITVEDALKAISVVSANDVSVAIAEHLAGSQDNFVAQMNVKAKELGMSNTNFMNPHGIDEDNHYTSAIDIALMSRELLVKHPGILRYTSIWMDTIRDGNFSLTNTNKLIRFYDGATGLKTGSTSKALFNLSASATRDGTSFIAVVLTAPTGDIRNEEIKQLLDYGFSNYMTNVIYTKGSIVANIAVNKSLGKDYEIIVDKDVCLLQEKGNEIEYSEIIEYVDNLVAPIEKGTVVGNIVISNKIDKTVIDKKNVIINEEVLKSNISDYYIHILKRLVTLT